MGGKRWSLRFPAQAMAFRIVGMSRDQKMPYLMIAFTFGVVGLSGMAGGQPSMLTFLILAGVFVWLGLNAGKSHKHGKDSRPHS